MIFKVILGILYWGACIVALIEALDQMSAYHFAVIMGIIAIGLTLSDILDELRERKK